VAASFGHSWTGAASQAQVAAWQVPSPQERAQEPQWLALVWRFTHELPQRSGVAAGHAHRPPLQDAPATQVTLHCPQWSASVWRSTHAPPQEV
jgi:hypothetical protein